ncbi:acyl-CoA dehydrogenase family protein [Caulobacter vibrioides]|jgi:alkylation response protein AidB-like acyl-CoA dehydrogenase|uniref:Acyl-CoA dehydrogenase n=1 Tax=Caulobacter vibrioides OR37 TaxID=1292034 RepID=R0D6J7_CAUVI|nr:acyl-CoA dehydrogenase family protein [Caulobacter vibrioides]ENZ83990.1 acyl-CoA dehydrogenase [Caulobacter vibrioides OR37]
MSAGLSPEDAAFRDEVRAFLDQALTPKLRRAGTLMTSVYCDHEAQLEWQALLYKRGWAAPSWPVEYGGCGWSAVQRYIFARERLLAGAPTSPLGINMVGPAIMAFGDPAQKAFFLPRMLSGEHLWCQGYSEPQAGSDLAALAMKAKRDGDHLVCTGTKIWTTHANVANWMFCLVRTDASGRKQQGITFLLIDMTSPGVTVRPIVMSSGEAVQSQVFFDEVRVPIENVVGGLGQGWTVAKYLLEYERGGSAYAPELQVKLAALRRDAAEALAANPLLAARLAETEVEVEVLDALEAEILSALSADKAIGTDASMMKILGTELQQRVTELALDAAGPLARAWQPGVAVPGGPVIGHPLPQDDHASGEVWQAIAPLRYLNERAGTIYAGANEIQRGILAKAELGL